MLLLMVEISIISTTNTRSFNTMLKLHRAKKIPDVRADYIFLNNGRLFFKNMSERNQVYEVNINTF